MIRLVQWLRCARNILSESMDQPSRRRISDRRHNRSATGYGRRLPFRVNV